MIVTQCRHTTRHERQNKAFRSLRSVAEGAASLSSSIELEVSLTVVLLHGSRERETRVANDHPNVGDSGKVVSLGIRVKRKV